MGSPVVLKSELSRCFPCMAARMLLVFLCLSSLPHSASAQGSDSIGQVVVRVRQRLNEDPLAQAQVQLIRFPSGIVGEQFTGSDGSVQFSGISVGGYNIRASLQGYEPGEAHVDFRKGDSTQQTVDISLSPLKQKAATTSGGAISAQELQIPENALKEFDRGRKLLHEKKSPAESIVALKRAIAFFPNYVDAYFLMGLAQLQLNDSAAAEASLRKSVSIDPSQTAHYYPLALLLFAQDRLDEEEELLLNARKRDLVDWRWPFELARCDSKRSHWQDALAYALEAKRNALAPSKVHLLLADIYSNSDRPNDAIAELETFSRLDPESPFMSRVREVLPELRRRVTPNSAPQN